MLSEYARQPTRNPLLKLHKDCGSLYNDYVIVQNNNEVLIVTTAPNDFEGVTRSTAHTIEQETDSYIRVGLVEAKYNIDDSILSH